MDLAFQLILVIPCVSCSQLEKHSNRCDPRSYVHLKNIPKKYPKEVTSRLEGPQSLCLCFAFSPPVHVGSLPLSKDIYIWLG